jgi:hypothetical protein
VRLEASTKPHVHQEFEIFWTNIASTMGCPNCKNRPKKGLRPLGVKLAPNMFVPDMFVPNIFAPGMFMLSTLEPLKLDRHVCAHLLPFAHSVRARQFSSIHYIRAHLSDDVADTWLLRGSQHGQDKSHLSWSVSQQPFDPYWAGVEVLRARRGGAGGRIDNPAYGM